MGADFKTADKLKDWCSDFYDAKCEAPTVNVVFRNFGEMAKATSSFAKSGTIPEKRLRIFLWQGLIACCPVTSNADPNHRTLFTGLAGDKIKNTFNVEVDGKTIKALPKSKAAKVSAEEKQKQKEEKAKAKADAKGSKSAQKKCKRRKRVSTCQVTNTKVTEIESFHNLKTE